MLSQAFIKTALIYLILGVSLGGLLLADKGLDILTWLWPLRPLHIEWLLLGWMLQLAMGGVNWIMPRPHHLKQQTALGWLSYGLLNGGLFLSTLFRLAPLLDLKIRLDWVLLVASMTQVGAVICFGVYIWGRASFALPLILLGNKPK